MKQHVQLLLIKGKYTANCATSKLRAVSV